MRVLWGVESKTDKAMRFQRELKSKGVACTIVNSNFVTRGLLGRHVSNHFVNIRTFDKLVHKFKPDIIVSGVNNFGLAAIKRGIPFVIIMGGDYWFEMEQIRKTYCTNQMRVMIFNHADKLRNKCLSGAAMIITINQYLADKVNDKLPGKLTAVVHDGLDAAEWSCISRDNNALQHPCVGLVQNANVWTKTKEMLILEHVIPYLPSVTFYWAGHGPYKNKILSVLKQFPNFQYLGGLNWPNGVKQFMSEIDLYLLTTGLDMQPSSLKEAQLLEKPVLATNVDNMSEVMLDGKSGYLVNIGDAKDLCTKIEMLLNNTQLSRKMGGVGRQFIQEKYALSNSVDMFVNALNNCLNATRPT